MVSAKGYFKAQLDVEAFTDLASRCGAVSGHRME
jgi:hypothetical protein